MGFCTSIVVNNDFVDEIGRDKNYGAKVCSAVLRCFGEPSPVEICHGSYAIESHHNDGIQMVLVGNGTGHRVDRGCTHLNKVEGNWERISDPAVEMRLLKMLAEKHGYRLARKPSKK
jgi:hypothetical protein